MQQTSGASDLATAGIMGPADADLDALRQELTKWQERVPKLAAALRERSGEVDTLRKELAQLAASRSAASGPSETGSGIEARDALIQELEAKVRTLGGRYQDTEGQLHARDLEIRQLREEAAEWRDKWQSVTASLDAQSDTSNRKDKELSRCKQEIDELLARHASGQARIKEQDLELTSLRERARSLENRNENLFETTELANRQIETLGGSLEQLRRELTASREAVSTHEQAASGALQDIEDLKSQLASREQDIEALTQRNQRLEAQLSERSDLVVGLEEERGALSTRTASLEAENRQLSESLDKARQTVDGNADHIAQIDARLERQKQHMDSLEAELVEVQESLAAARKAHQRELSEKDARLAELEEQLDQAVAALDDPATRESSDFEGAGAGQSGIPDDVSAENQALQAEVVKLEGIVRERTEALNKLRWQQDMIEQQADADGSDSKMLVVLNQQLQSARDDNQRLKHRIRELETGSSGSLEPAAAHGPEAVDGNSVDDLTRIRGIGPKLVRQLSRLGINRFDQIGMLSESDLDDEAHPLHGMKGRILKDNWIGQAAKLGGVD